VNAPPDPPAAAPAGAPPPLLAVEHLTTTFDIGGRPAAAVNDVSFTLSHRETLGLVGESGSGKTVAALSILRLIRPPGRIAAGRVLFDGVDLLRLGDEEMREVRGGRIGFVFQDAASALNPVLTIGEQVAETLVAHGRATRRSARAEAVDLLASVRIPDPAARAHDYPHQLSGGQRQRASIALALACRPPLLVADEPTTALDVTIQAEILDLLEALKAERDLALLLISHDLGVVAQVADRVAVMYAGRIVEEAPVGRLFADPHHPYTRALLASMPGGAPGSRLQAIDGAVPAIDAVPAGCAFAPRCASRLDLCDTTMPAVTRVSGAHLVRCHLHTGVQR
jgi:oligopeptide/dipeptide ABC transporter ATP-binding protein